MATTNGKDSKVKGVKNTVYDPKDFKIEPVKLDDFEKYAQFITEHFIPREQLSLGLKVGEDEHLASLRDVMKSWISSPASICVTYTPSNELAGIMFTHILTRKESETFGREDMEKLPQSVQYLLRILSLLQRSAKLFEDPKVDKVLEIAATIVSPKFSGNKLTYRLTEESEKLAAGVGCQIVTTQSTNVITQHIRTKMEYEVCYTLDYANFELDGKKVIDVSVMNGTTVAKVFKKYLRKV